MSTNIIIQESAEEDTTSTVVDETNQGTRIIVLETSVNELGEEIVVESHSQETDEIVYPVIIQEDHTEIPQTSRTNTLSLLQTAPQRQVSVPSNELFIQNALMSNRPTLLRRPRIHHPNNPLLSHQHFVFQDYCNKAIESQQHQSSSNVHSTSASELPPVSAFLRKSNSLEEIIIWEPGNGECEIVEVDEADLTTYLEDKETLQPNQNQQIILLTNDSFQQSENIVQNYIIQIQTQAQVPPPVEIKSGERINVPRKGIRKKIINQSQRSSTTIVQESGRGDNNELDETEILQKKRKKNVVESPCQEEGCNEVVHSVNDLRIHLESIHGKSFEDEQIYFNSQQEFNNWRAKYEQEHEMSFIYRGGTKKISTEKAVVYMICHRSGIYKSSSSADRRRKMKPQGSCKIGTHCTAGIKVIKHLNTGGVDALICHTHYGHTLNNAFLRLTNKFKDTILQKFNEGLSFPEVLQYVHHNPEQIEGLRLVDRRAIRNVYDQWKKQNEMKTKDSGCPFENQDSDPCQSEEAEKAEEVNLPENSFDVEKNKELKIEFEEEEKNEKIILSSEKEKNRSTVSSSEIDSSSPKVKISKHQKSSNVLDTVVRKLLENGGKDSSGGASVLFYKKPGESTPQIGNEFHFLGLDDLCLVVQTPMQRALLDEFGKIIHLELVCGDELNLLGVVVVDEFLLGIPVAWMISNKTSDKLIQNFFQILQNNSTNLCCDFLFLRKQTDLQRIWNNVFTLRKPRILYPQEDVFRELKIILRKYYEDVSKREKIFTILQKMVTTPHKIVFDQGWIRLKEKAVEIPSSESKEFLSFFMSEWLEKCNRWAFHIRTQIHPRVEECFLKLRKFVLFKGTKFLNKNLEDILKIGYDKCFQHQRNLMKGEIKIQNLLNQIQTKHYQATGTDWRIDRDSHGIVWKVNGFEVVNLRTICRCVLRCESCNICSHAFSCTCGDDNICVHIHAVMKTADDIGSTSTTGASSEVASIVDLVEVWGDDQFPVQEKEEEESSSVSEDEEEEKKELIPVASRKRKSIQRTSFPKKKKQNLNLKTMITNPSSTPRRISTRLQAKVKSETLVEEKEEGSKKEESESGSNKTSKKNITSQVYFQMQRHEPKFRKEKDTIKRELLSIIHEIDVIQDQDFLYQVKEKVNELCTMVVKK